jgi:FlaA1/EpsC-like NDP-sugar epimerase
MTDYKRYIVLFIDILIIYLGFILALVVYNDFSIVMLDMKNFTREFPFVLLIYIVTFELFGMYKSLWKFAGIEELLRGGFANFISITLGYIVVLIFNIGEFSFSLYFIAFFVVSTGTIGMRLSYRLYDFYKNYMQDNTKLKRTFIIGAGNAGVMLLDEMKTNKDFEKRVIGFIDDNPKLKGKTIHGIPVLGQSEQIVELADKYEIDSIIIAIPSLSLKATTDLINQVEKTGCQIKLMPPFYEMVGKTEDLVKIRDVKIEDLLGRDPIFLEETGIKEYIEEETILVTGGGGSIGSELVRQLHKFHPARIVIIDIYENSVYDLQMELERLYRTHVNMLPPEIVVLIASVRDKERMEEIFKKFKPKVVFHAAAHKHVPLMEVSPKEALKNNVFGTYNVALLSDQYKVKKFVLISTDKAVNPTNIMGASKRMAERVVMSLNKTSKTDYVAVRFGNVLGSNGSVIPLFRKQIEDRGPVTVTDPEITRFFMTIPEACQLVIQAGAYAKGGELFVLDMGKPVKIIHLAEKMVRLAGLEPYKEIDIIFTGLRPGEKMYEELLVDFEKAIKTDNDKIYIEPKERIEDDDILTKLDEIQDSIHKCTDKECIRFAKQIVKTYK